MGDSPASQLDDPFGTPQDHSGREDVHPPTLRWPRLMFQCCKERTCGLRRCLKSCS
jgi:hypothetical protein